MWNNKLNLSHVVVVDDSMEAKVNKLIEMFKFGALACDGFGRVDVSMCV